MTGGVATRPLRDVSHQPGNVVRHACIDGSDLPFSAPVDAQRERTEQIACRRDYQHRQHVATHHMGYRCMVTVELHRKTSPRAGQRPENGTHASRRHWLATASHERTGCQGSDRKKQREGEASRVRLNPHRVLARSRPPDVGKERQNGQSRGDSKRGPPLGDNRVTKHGTASNHSRPRRDNGHHAPTKTDRGDIPSRPVTLDDPTKRCESSSQVKRACQHD